MPLSKYPIEIPLGGAVDEGNVPEIVQPPRIREATDCASIKGGAYTKKDAQEVLQDALVPDDSIDIQRSGDATLLLRPTALRTLRDGGGASDSYPSPFTGRPLTGFYPTEGDGVKQTGDHATLVDLDGRERTLVAWDRAQGGSYFADPNVSFPPAPAEEPPDPTPVMWGMNPNVTWSYARGAGARYGMFEGDTQQGEERSYEALTFVPAGSGLTVGSIVGFPRVRADQNAQLFWSACVIANGENFHLSTRTPPVLPELFTRDVRDVLNVIPNPTNGSGATPVSPGCKLYVHDAFGNVQATAVTEDGSAGLGPQLLPALELIVVPGEGVYTLHPSLAPGPGVTCDIRKWQFDFGTGEIVPDPVSPVASVLGAPDAWPAGLHDMGDRLMLMWSDTRRDVRSYDLAAIATQTPADWGDAVGLDPAQQGLSGGAGGYARMSFTVRQGVTAPIEETTQTLRMTRGLWAGSFLSPEPAAPGLFWVGVQIVNDDADALPLPVVPPDFKPTLAAPYSGSVLHALVDDQGAVVAADFGQPSVGILPGCAIASQAASVPGIGACVGVYASCPGDTRSALATNVSSARCDVLSTTFLLLTRRSVSQLIDDPVPAPMDPALSSASNQPVAVAQLLPQGQSLGTYIVNPYQVRPNLDVRPDGTARFMCFERRAIGTFLTDDYGETFPQSERPCGDAAQAAPYLASLSPEPFVSTARARGYVCADGAAPISSGGPQGLASGYGFQALFDGCAGRRRDPELLATFVSPSTSYPGTFPETGTWANIDPTPGPEAPGQLFSVAAHIVTEDENGGAHRSVPVRADGVQFFHFASTPFPPDPDKPVDGCGFVLYPFPLAALGLPNSQRGYVELYGSGPDGTALMEETARCAVPITGFNLWNAFVGPVSLRVGGSYDTLDPEGGSGQALYTDSGELAADAPDPSACVASARSRVWSVSSTRPRLAQYTKLLRAGYAPEWNGNLTLRVPGTSDPLTAVSVLPDGRVLLFSATSIHYTYGEGPSDTGQGAGFAEPSMLTDTVGCSNKRSIATGDFGCVFQGDRGFYLVDRQLAVSYIGLPYEDTAVGDVLATATDGYRSEIIFYSAVTEDGQQQRWVYNYLRQQWSTFENADRAIGACEREARPLTLISDAWEVQSVTRAPAAVAVLGTVETGTMSLATGWLAMGKIQGYGRTWEVQLTGIRDPGSLSGLRVEIYYDYIDTPLETYTFDDVGNGQFKVRFRPRKQKSEAISFRFSEYVPTGVLPADCTGWRLDMCTVLAGVNAGLDKVAVTVRSS